MQVVPACFGHCRVEQGHAVQRNGDVGDGAQGYNDAGDQADSKDPAKPLQHLAASLVGKHTQCHQRWEYEIPACGGAVDLGQHADIDHEQADQDEPWQLAPAWPITEQECNDGQAT
ncbi:hypothetical protein D3C79_781860 [compost metagenome]